MAQDATVVEKRRRFQALHQGEGAFLLPNPWDIGTAKALAGMGAAALATTSSGHAATLGFLDGEGLVSRDEALAHAAAINDAVDAPVAGDFENGYGDTPEAAAETVRRAVELGLAGCSIEDSAMSESQPSYPFELSVRRVEAAVAAARAAEGPFTFTARADGMLVEGYDLAEAIKRLQAFEAAGADVLYAPFIGDAETVKEIVAAVSKPVNVLAIGRLSKLSVAEFAALGVKRVSLGGGLARVAQAAFVEASARMFSDGDLTGLAMGKGADKFDAFLT